MYKLYLVKASGNFMQIHYTVGLPYGGWHDSVNVANLL